VVSKGTRTQRKVFLVHPSSIPYGVLMVVGSLWLEFGRRNQSIYEGR
jgi:hypothetical protein